MRRIGIVFTVLFALAAFAQLALADEPQAFGPKQEATVGENTHATGLIVPEEVKKRFEELDKLPSPALIATQERWDWREMNGVTPVKSQGNCGSCWDFAATGACESAVLIADQVEWDLSEQQVIDCNVYGYGCGGGWMEAVYLLFRDYGAVEESCYPYRAQDWWPCEQETCDVVVQIEDWIDVQNDINAIKNAVLQAPVSTTLKIPSGFHWDCFWYSGFTPDHAVMIVGWDDNICDGGGWICKNSWSTGWGDEGFFYIPYGSCGIGHYTEQPVYVHRPVILSCESLTPTFCRGGEFYFKLTIVNNTEGDISGTMTFRGYFGHDCDPGSILVSIPRHKTYPQGVTENSYFFKVPNSVAAGQYSASVSGNLSGHEVTCCMNLEIVQCSPWKMGDNVGWELVETGRRGGEEFRPTIMSLSQSYPNPFNANAVISYELGVTADVRLEVYNILGERVATLVNEKQDAGEQSVLWDASNAPSGVYFYKLTAGDYSETKRMMLVK
jgi:hypothetical protein